MSVSAGNGVTEGGTATVIGSPPSALTVNLSVRQSSDYVVSGTTGTGKMVTIPTTGSGPNALWQSIYTKLDRLETCRAN